MRGKRTKKIKKFSEAELEDLRNQLARALADYDNLRKRTEAEIEDRVAIVKARLVIKLISVFDMLEEAQEHLKDSGLAITIKEFEDVLTQEGLGKIDAKKGMKFDEEIHEAVEVINPPSGGKGKSREIVEVLLTGWKFTGGPVIRPAKVKVYK
jgi:molecular chaperone GrpE